MVQCRYLGTIGGKDMTESTRRIMRTVMTNSVAHQMNFAGRGGKKRIKDMRLLQVIIGICSQSCQLYPRLVFRFLIY
jgi:hypothetical protein